MSPSPNEPPAFHLLVKPTGAICNLAWAYCFYLSKEKLYPGSRFRMTEEMLETYIRRLIEAHRVPEVTIAWQGGEPMLMDLDFFRGTGLNFLCAGYKAFFKHIDRPMRIMTGLLRENRAPAEIMKMYANEQVLIKTSLVKDGGPFIIQTEKVKY